MNISRTASAFLRGVYFVREHAMAQDAKDTPEGTRWVTIGHTEEHKGQHVLISKKDGEVFSPCGQKALDGSLTYTLQSRGQYITY